MILQLVMTGGAERSERPLRGRQTSGERDRD